VKKGINDDTGMLDGTRCEPKALFHALAARYGSS
jgi:hypothetical protein